jgi:uncharacterized metal-binding protein
MAASLPIVYACAGCSNAGRLSYNLARAIDDRGAAEMSCLAGVAARKPTFLKQLRGREVWLIDGCPIECAGGVMREAGLAVDVHVKLHQLGVRKHEPAPSPERFEELVEAAVGCRGGVGGASSPCG